MISGWAAEWHGEASAGLLIFFFRTGLTQNHNISFQSGGENFTQFTSLGYFDQEGILQDSDLKRFSIRNNVTGRSDNERFTYGTQLSINLDPDLVPELALHQSLLGFS